MGGYFVICAIFLWACALVVYDLKAHRLPNFLTLPAGICALGWAFRHSNTTEILLAASLWPILYLVQISSAALWHRLCKQSHARGLGGGDIKLAIPLAIMAAAAGGGLAVLLAAGTASLLSLLTALFRNRRYVAHGPAMILATVMVSILLVE